jgi:hypothetical protein
MKLRSSRRALQDLPHVEETIVSDYRMVRHACCYGAIADVPHTPLDAANRGVTTQRDTEDAAIHRLLEQFRTIKIPLSEAVAIAEHLHDGSRTADVNFEISGPPIYRVRTVINERIWENVIDANTGSVTEKEISSSLRELDREDLGNIVALKSVEQELSDAVRIAERAAREALSPEA